MQIHVNRERSHVRECDDLKGFSVVVEDGANDEEIARALTPLGTLDSSTHAWVSIARLRTACGRDGDAAWHEAFDAMVQFAASKGWVDGTGLRLRAHLIRSPEATTPVGGTS
jgi:hypothetical protein